MYFSLVIAFLLLLGIIVVSVQNSMPLDLRFITWKLQISLTALILYSSLFGASIVGILALPKLATKSFKVRSLNKKNLELKKRILELEGQNTEEAEVG